MCEWNYKIRLWIICFFFAAFGMVPSRIAGFFPNNAQETMHNFITRSLYGNSPETPASTSVVNIIWGVYIAQSGPCTVLGSMLAPIAANRLGRVRSIALGLLMAVPGFAFQFMAILPSAWFLLLVGQFCVYVSMAFLYVVLPIFVSESAPPAYRGRFGTVQFIGVAVGTLLGAIIGLPEVLGREGVWQYAYAICIILGLIGLPMALIIKETPVALVVKGKLTSAKQSLEYYRSPESISTDWNNILLDAASKQKGQQSGFRSIAQLFRIKQLRQSLNIAMILSLAYPIPVLMNAYSTPMLQQMGFAHSIASYITSSLMVASIVSYFICTLMIDRFGRWPLVILGTVGSTMGWALMALCQLIRSYLTFNVEADMWLGVLFCIGLYTVQICLNAGIRPIFWVVIPEIFPFQYRVPAKSFAVAIAGVYAFVTLFLFFVILQAMPIVAHLLVTMCLFICSVFMFNKLPETKKKAPHEIFPALLEILPQQQTVASNYTQFAPVDDEEDYEADASNSSEITPLNPIQKTYT